MVQLHTSSFNKHFRCASGKCVTWKNWPIIQMDEMDVFGNDTNVFV